MTVEPLDWLMPGDLPAALASLLHMTASSRCAPCRGCFATSLTVQQRHHLSMPQSVKDCMILAVFAYSLMSMKQRRYLPGEVPQWPLALRIEQKCECQGAELRCRSYKPPWHRPRRTLC